MPDKKELRLSDAFQQPTTQPDIEVVAHMLNINYGHNKELMERCQKLKEYAQFIDIIRHYLRENEQWTNEQAISKAIDDCIQNNILRDILQKERLRVMASILSEFDEVGYKEMIRQEAYEDAYEEGHEAGLEEGREQELAHGVKSYIKLAQSIGYAESKIVTMLMQEFNLSEDQASQYVQKFWKDK